MTFEEYQKLSITTELMKRDHSLGANDPAMVAKILGLVGEAGEVAEKFKKIVRDNGGVIAESDVQNIKKELGDVLWYINALSSYLDLSLEEVAKANLDKVLDRQARKVQQGSGDDR